MNPTFHKYETFEEFNNDWPDYILAPDDLNKIHFYARDMLIHYYNMGIDINLYITDKNISHVCTDELIFYLDLKRFNSVSIGHILSDYDISVIEDLFELGKFDDIEWNSVHLEYLLNSDSNISEMIQKLALLKNYGVNLPDILQDCKQDQHVENLYNDFKLLGLSDMLIMNIMYNSQNKMY